TNSTANATIPTTTPESRVMPPAAKFKSVRLTEMCPTKPPANAEAMLAMPCIRSSRSRSRLASVASSMLVEFNRIDRIASTTTAMISPETGASAVQSTCAKSSDNNGMTGRPSPGTEEKIRDLTAAASSEGKTASTSWVAMTAGTSASGSTQGYFQRVVTNQSSADHSTVVPIMKIVFGSTSDRHIVRDKANPVHML